MGQTPAAAGARSSAPGETVVSVADAIVGALVELSVRYVFGVSGANIEHLHDALHRRGRNCIHAVLARSESGAAFMADCHARVHGTLGVCCATSGGAMMNLVPGIAEARADSVPVLAIVGQAPSELQGRGAFQDSSGVGRAIDAEMLWRAVAKHVAVLRRPDDVWPHLAEAVVAALTGRPGPAVLLVPRDLFEARVSPHPPWWLPNLRERLQPKMPRAAALDRLVGALERSGRPAMLIGPEVRRSSDPQAVIELARATGLPVATTMSARGEFPNDDPLYLGTVGVAGHPSVHRFLSRQADLLLVLGTSLDVMTRSPLGQALAERRIAVVNADAGDVGRLGLDIEVMIEADAGEVCRMLLGRLAERPYRAPGLEGYVLERYDLGLARAVPADPRRTPPAGDLLLQREALAILEPYMPREGHLVLDAGNCAAAAVHYTAVPAGTTSTLALGMGGMGYAIAGAIGAQLGSQEGARTMVVAGDGAFLMEGFEVHTAVDLGLPILFVIFNNAMHGMCVTRQQRYFGGRLEAARYAPVDVAQVVRGFGPPERLWVGSAGSVPELERQLEDHERHAHLPGVLELRLHREEVPPFTPFLPRDAPTIRVPRE